MSHPVIDVHNLSKEYHIGGPQKTYDRLGEQITDTLLAPFRRAGKLLRGQASGAAELDERFWALSDVSFSIRQGETVGIIGRNGAGKSTLLKILSQITEPSQGYADLYGRVGSLLEVGTGFHPELTGRENVFLNGAILGMHRHEITHKFDEIVAFAEIDKFIDTPVKHYSSGMYVRLAFSVAAHLEPEILLVDEVLAVGDAAFQKKCLGKMDDVAQQGRTVLFVSHNMSLMQTLCQRGLFLENGQLIMDGPIDTAVAAYLQALEQSAQIDLAERKDRQGAGNVKVQKIEILDEHHNGGKTVLKTGSSARFVFELSGQIAGMSCVFTVYDQFGQAITNFKSDVPGPDDIEDGTIGWQYMCDVDELMFIPGRYTIDVLIRGGGEWQDFIQGAASFDVEPGHMRGRPATQDDKTRLLVSMPHRWTRPAGY